MPFHRLRRDIPIPKQEFDYTIIGAGAAGINLALSLSKKGAKVMLIESGLFDLNERHQQLNNVILTGKNMNGITSGRKRAVGGTTLAWGGQSLPFSELDFEERNWVNNSGWPLKYKDIGRYYAEANKFMGIDNSVYYGNKVLSTIKLKDPGFNTDLLEYHVSKWAKEPNFKKLYHKELEKNIFVLFDATLDHIHKNTNGNITHIDIINFEGTKLNLSVKTLIISAGGIETNRILLNQPELFSDSQNYSLLGRGYMDHPCITAGYVITNNIFRLQKFFNTHIKEAKKISLRLSLSKKVQIQKELLNGSASILFEHNNATSDVFKLIKDLRNNRDLKSILRYIKYSPKILKSVFAYFMHAFLYKSDVDANLVLMLEQESIQSSFISLSDSLDELGHRIVKVNWDISDSTWKTAISLSKMVKDELERLKFGHVILDSRIEANNKHWKELLSDVNHHMGGCKMSLLPKQGIVDKNLKVWSINNLYLASCAVFPSTSHSNPTLTLLALCQRLTAHLTNEDA
jgi:hypothetical protein